MNVLKQPLPVLFGAVVVVAVGVTGCTTSKATSSRTTSIRPPTRTSTRASAPPVDASAAYVRAVDKLCSQTAVDVVKIVPSGYSASTPVSSFLKQAPRLRKIYRAFDLQFAKIPVPPGAAAAAASMHAYVRTSDATKKMAIAAAAKGQKPYHAEYNRQIVYWSTGAGGAVVAKRDAAGITEDCNYR